MRYLAIFWSATYVKGWTAHLFPIKSKVELLGFLRMDQMTMEADIHYLLNRFLNGLKFHTTIRILLLNKNLIPPKHDPVLLKDIQAKRNCVQHQVVWNQGHSRIDSQSQGITIIATGLLMHWTSYQLFANHHQLRTTCVAPIRLWYHTLRHQLPVGQLKMGSWRKRCDHLAPQGLRAEVDWLYQMIGTRYSISTGYTIELLSLVFVHSEGLRAPSRSWNVSCIY